MSKRKICSIGEDTSYFRDKSHVSKIEKSTMLRNSMNQHRELNEQCATASGPRHVCLCCGKKYKWLDNLRRYQRVDCGNKGRKFPCHLCDRKFKYRCEITLMLVIVYESAMCQVSAFVFASFPSSDLAVSQMLYGHFIFLMIFLFFHVT